MVRSEGGRLLTEEAQQWSENAWDHVAWSEEHERVAQEAITKQKAAPVSQEQQAVYNGQPAVFWDEIYSKVTDTMYKDRSWLREEFTELNEALQANAGPRVIAELGCGPGNTAFPLLSHNANPDLHIHALDFSKQAVAMVKANEAYDEQFITSAVWDVADDSGPPTHIVDGSVDIVVCIFVLSALHPSQWAKAVENIHRMLKPGGVVLFRDYGRHDLVQLRFKQSRLMEDNLYVRGDGTRVYFFEQAELENMFAGQSKPLFETTKIELDRRLLLNRKRKLQMWRCWLQARWKKLSVDHKDAGDTSS